MRHISKAEFNSKLKKIELKNQQIELKNQLKAEKNKYKKSKKMSTSNKVLIASILAVVLFTIACLFIQYKTGVEISSTLITLWFSFWTVEIVALTGIKISKVFRNYEHISYETDESTNFNDDSEAVG